jgi:hypothetical protein
MSSPGDQGGAKMSGFKKATKSQAKLRMAITGPSGSGKTYTALSLASALGSVAVIDTERGSASKYADLFSFDVLELTEYNPRNYVNAIKEARDAVLSNGKPYDVLVIDSLSHAWTGQGGILELVDRAAKRSQSQNSFAAWRDVTPLHNQLVDTILTTPVHIIATMRSKTEYVLEKDERGKTAPRKVGLAPVQRDGMEYEFDVVAEMDMDNNLIISKSRIISLTGAVINRPGAQLGEMLRAWLSDGEPTQTPAPSRQPSAPKAREERLTIAEPAPTPLEVPAEQPAEEVVVLGNLPQTLGELKQRVIVEKKWIRSGELHWRSLIDSLRKQGEITDEDDFPAMYLAIEKYYADKDLESAAGQ